MVNEEIIERKKRVEKDVRYQGLMKKVEWRE